MPLDPFVLGTLDVVCGEVATLAPFIAAEGWSGEVCTEPRRLFEFEFDELLVRMDMAGFVLRGGLEEEEEEDAEDTMKDLVKEKDY